MDINLKQIANDIFSNSPQEPNTIDLQLHEQSDSFDNQDKVVFDILITLLSYGIQILFKTNGAKVDLRDINDMQIELMNSYFKSFSWEVELLNGESCSVVQFKSLKNGNYLNKNLILNY